MRRSRGFTLLEIMLVLVITGVLAGMVAVIARGMMAGLQRSNTATAMQAADLSLISFVATTHRLPCPADGALSPSDALYGREQRDQPPTGTGDCLNGQNHGVLPWVTLGLSSAQASDGYGSLLMYRAAPGLTREDAMNLSYCDPAGAAPVVGTAPFQSCSRSCPGGLTACTPPGPAIVDRGLEIRTGGGVPVGNPAAGTGAAYVVVSHGANHAHAYGSTGVVQDATGTVGVGEAQNAADAPLTAFYVDAEPDESETASHFDDIVIRHTMLTVAGLAGLGPRGH